MYGETLYDDICLYFEILLTRDIFNKNHQKGFHQGCDTSEFVKWDSMSDAHWKTYPNVLDFLVSGR